MKTVRPIYPPPGMNLKLPDNLDVNTFFRQIGGDCEEYADKFEEGGLQHVFRARSIEMKQMGIPTV